MLACPECGSTHLDEESFDEIIQCLDCDETFEEIAAEIVDGEEEDNL